MDILEAIKSRHSVRQYKDAKISEETRAKLAKVVKECNEEGELNISIRYDDVDGFDSKLAKYGNFVNVRNYIVLAGKDCEDFEEKCGYYGEKIVIAAQMLGLNTCWAAMTFNKKAVQKLIEEGDRFCMVIALGHGASQGVQHKNKPIEKIVATKGNMPDWFEAGVEAAMLAPTAMNQQKFVIGIIDGKPAVRVAGMGFYTQVDLGIVKYHFEVGSGRKLD